MKQRLSLAHTFLPAFLLLTNGLHGQICSTPVTRGTYVVICSGYLSPSANAPLVPAKILGTATADDNGAFKGNTTVSLGGMAVLTQTVSGTEKLNPDCTGSITYAQTINGQPGPPLDITFVVSQHGDRIDGLATDPGTVLSCTLTRLSIFTSARAETGNDLAGQSSFLAFQQRSNTDNVLTP
jgi:hypothetical protein